MSEVDFICRSCAKRHDLDDLEEVEEEEKDHSYFICPDCGGKKFTRIPKDVGE